MTIQVTIYYDGRYWTTLNYLQSDTQTIHDAVMELADLEGKDRLLVHYKVQPNN